MAESAQTVVTSPTLYIESKEDHDMQLEFTLRNIDVSIANAIRRTVLSDIPTIAFKCAHPVIIINRDFINIQINYKKESL